MNRVTRLALCAWVVGCAPVWAQPQDASSSADTDHHTSLGAIPMLEKVHVWGGKQGKAALPVAPTTEITALEMESINLSTIEDAVAYEPSMIVRRRFIGDANGSLGIRGANMFQTARTMVYADGLPLHYHLQTRWSGAPRWSLVAPDEVEAVEVVYGPFSAMYPGNAMGGVVRIKTRTPAERSLKLEGALFNQFYDHLATDEDYSGGRFSASYGDKLGALTLFAFYNHLQNRGQPQSQHYASPTQGGNASAATVVSGGILATDASGAPAIYYGDSGAEESTTDLFKVKLGYDWQDYSLYSTVAYEDRRGTTNEPNNFLRSASGDAVWSGPALLDGHLFQLNSSNFAEQYQDRRSLLLGAGVTGPLWAQWDFDLNVSHFQILEDVAGSSLLNTADSAYTPAGRVTEYDDTGWRTLDFHTSNAQFAGSDQMKLTLGAHYGHYQLDVATFDFEDYLTRTSGTPRSASGGETTTAALFAEYFWQFAPRWDLTLGARYEDWQSQGGYLDGDTYPDRDAKGVSPKFSLGFLPNADWELRYSLARALRFALVEELYHNESLTNAVQTANPGLAPEEGLHHNLMIERSVGAGYARVNIFSEQVEDTIFNQLGLVNGVEISTFLAIDEVTTRGAEFILNQPQFFHPNVDMRFNLSYLNAEITRNSVNPAIEGNDFPRMPNWQSNLLVSYRPADNWHLSSGLHYASESYGELDNSDTAERTFGAHDSYLFFNLRAGWQATTKLKLAAGLDNVTDEVAYVYHPWPSRTLYLEAGYEF